MTQLQSSTRNSSKWRIILAAALTVGLVGAVGITTLLAVTGSDAPANAAVEERKIMLGQPAPDFTLPDQNDKPVKLSDQKGKWVVLAFYPADMTKGCTFQNRSYTEHVSEFAPKNAVVYTVSTQDTKSKQEFCSKESLKHTLLSDVGGKVAKEYGALMDNTSFANRWTYYIAPDGTVAYIDKVIKVGTAATDSLALLEKLSQEKK